jgi:hypothetical protein
MEQRKQTGGVQFGQVYSLGRRNSTGSCRACFAPHVAGESASAVRLPRSDWPTTGFLCVSAALSRRFSSSTKGYISPKFDPSASFSPSNCSFPFSLHT